MLGHMLCRQLSQAHEVWGSCRGDWSREPLAPVLPRERCVERLECTDAAALRETLERLRPDVVLNCVGVIKQKPDAHDAMTQIRVNALLPHELARAADSVGAKVVQFSTDCVFSGRRGRYREEDLPDPVDVYGCSKLLGEIRREPHLTLRTSIVGRQLRGTESLFEWFLSQRGGRVRGHVHAIYSGLTTLALARLLGRLLEEHFDFSGLYHVASRPVSKFELLRQVNDRLDLGIRIEPDEKLRCDRSLDGRAFEEATGLRVPSWERMIDEFAEDCPRYETWRTPV